MAGRLCVWTLVFCVSVCVLQSQGEELSCRQCGAGQYLNATSVCTQCPVHSHTTAAGSTRIEDCDCNAGFSPGASGCAQCAQGTFKVGFADTLCISCGADRDTLDVGSTGPNQCLCVPAMYDVGGVCALCPGGTAKSFISNDVCSPCEANDFCAVGSETSSPCPGNSESPAESDSVLDCLCNAGYTLRADNSTHSCEPCAAGTYKDAVGTEPCTSCRADTYNTEAASTAVSSCSACPVGAASISGSDQPTDCTCNKGYSGGPGTNCAPCERGTYSTGVDRQSAENICEECPMNSYNAELGMVDVVACIGCPVATSTAGASRQEDVANCVCNAGYRSSEQESNVARTCTACSAGTYQNLANQLGCIDCVPGTYSVSAAQTDAAGCTECEHGSFSASSGQTRCDLCPHATWQALLAGRDTVCGGCPGNSGHAKTGVTDVTECKCNVGYRFDPQSFTGDPPVVTAASHAQLGCVSCAAGFFCSDMYWGGPDGFVGNGLSPGQTQQCAANTYSTVGQQTACSECGEHSRGAQLLMVSNTLCACRQGSSGTHHTECTPCLAGTFQPALVEVVTTHVPVTRTCASCAAGTYSDAQGASACKLCATLSSSPAGSDNQNDCTCNSGFYRPRADDNSRNYAAECGICEAGFFCVDGGFESCHAHSWSPPQSHEHFACTCNAGFFSTAMVDKVCNICDAKSWCSGGEHKQQCPQYSSSPAQSSAPQACVCDDGYRRSCADSACVVNWSEPCQLCLAGEICSEGNMLHCPDNSTTQSAGNALGANCVCNPGFSEVAAV